MITWTTLHERIQVAAGLTADVVREARTLMATSPAWWSQLSAEQRAAECRAQVEIFAAIKRHLDDGHTEHGDNRRYIASHDVVVTCPTDVYGVPIKCIDPICCAWYRRAETKGEKAP